MFDTLALLTDTVGFVPRATCGEWTPEWIAVHTGADVLIWLAYLSIPLVLLAVARHPAARPLRPLVWLFAAFIVACGVTHLIDALLFQWPVYRLSGAMKVLTAAVSWATVFALIPAARRLVQMLDALPAGAAVAEPVPADREPPALVYALAVLVAALAVLLRYILDPLLGDLHVFSISLLAVTFLAWYGGYGPALVTLLVTGAATLYLFVPPRQSFAVAGLNHQFGAGLFLFTALGILVLGEVQRHTRRRLRAKVAQLRATTAALADAKGATDAALGRLDAFLRHAPYGIAYLDPDLRFVRVNDTFARTHGVPIDAHLGRPLTDVLPDYPADLLADYRRVLDTGTGFAHRLVRGPDLIWEVTAFAVPDAGGRRGLGVIGLDVTERERAIDRTRVSEERFRAMADGIPQLAWMTRPDGHIFWYNQRWYDYTGTTLAEMDGWGWEKVHDPVELKRVRVTWPAALAAGEPWEDTFPLRRHDGQMRWHLSRAIPLKDEYGRVLLWFGTNTDITGQRETETALRESEGRFRTLTDTMPQIVWTARPDGERDSFNARWYEYTGLTPAQSLGRAWVAAVHPDDVERTAARLADAISTGRAFDLEYRLRRHDGDHEWFLARGVAVRDEAGAVVRWLGTSTGIDEKVKTAQALQLSEARFRELADAMPQIVYATDPVGRVVFINSRWIEYTGQADAQSADLAPLVPPDELGAMLGRWAAAVATGTPFEAEFRLLGRGEAGYRWFLTRAVPVRDAAGQVVRWYGTSTDIHEHKRIEQEVRDSASQLRQLTEGMPMLMWACRPDGECDYLSRQWMAYTGAGLEEQLGVRWLDALHPDDRAGTAEAWRHAVRVSGEYDIEFRLRRHDGEYRWFAVRGIPLRDQGGDIVRWYGSCTDIDDRKRQTTTLEKMVTERTATLHRTNASLREQQIFLDAILNSVAEGIVACDGDGRLKLFNAATLRMHGLPAEPLAPDRWAEHYRLFEADGVTPMPADRVPLLRAWRGEEVRDAEMMLRTTDGADRYVLCSGVQLRSADGSQFGAVVSMRDMTERREYERQLLVTAAALVDANEALGASNVALKASNEELEKFAYIASHDLQEPLRKIQAFGTRLAGKHRDVLGEQGKDYIDRMLDSAGRMRKLIEDLLSFSRVAAKPVSFDPVDLTAVVRDVLQDLELRVQQSGGRVEVGPLPFVRGDAGQLRRVFQNLIGNALKFARPGVPPVVTVTAVPFDHLPSDADPAPPTGAGWRVTVTDNGIGFEQGYAERIFELFQRLHARVQYEGTGLGLAIVRKIVLRHGATVAARGKPNEGAAFLIDWPQRTLSPT